MSMNTLEYANQLLTENAQLNAEVARLKSKLSHYSMSPGWADQRMNESKFVRIALGFDADADDVSPKDLVDAIAALQEQVRALTAEVDIRAEQNKFLAVENDRLQTLIYKNILPYRQKEFIPGDIDELISVTSQHMSKIQAQCRAEGIHFAANRMLAAWESGFINDTPAAAYDISGAVLSAVEFLPNADEGEFKRDYADEVRARIRAGEQP